MAAYLIINGRRRLNVCQAGVGTPTTSGFGMDSDRRLRP